MPLQGRSFEASGTRKRVKGDVLSLKSAGNPSILLLCRYSLCGFSFCAAELFAEIQKHIPGFKWSDDKVHIEPNASLFASLW
jgi:hypothetical protein